MQKAKFKATTKCSYRASFMWVIGLGYKKNVCNQDGTNVLVIETIILPFCMVETVQQFRRSADVNEIETSAQAADLMGGVA